MNGRSEQQRCVDVAIGRQRRDQVLAEVGRDLRRLRQHVGRAADDVDGFGDGRRTHRRVDWKGLRRGQRGRLGHGLEAAQLERDCVRARRQQRQHEVAVLRRHDRADALQVRRRRVHGHARQGQALRIGNVSGNRAVGGLGRRQRGDDKERDRGEQPRSNKSHTRPP